MPLIFLAAATIPVWGFFLLGVLAPAIIVLLLVVGWTYWIWVWGYRLLYVRGRSYEQMWQIRFNNSPRGRALAAQAKEHHG